MLCVVELDNSCFWTCMVLCCGDSVFLVKYSLETVHLWSNSRWRQCTCGDIEVDACKTWTMAPCYGDSALVGMLRLMHAKHGRWHLVMATDDQDDGTGTCYGDSALVVK
ncbi:hypothetical protein Droror1_Dr00010759 [Drosera rotundifolia]